MCGIVGYIGAASVRDILLKGLKRLEYRGYDSAGVAVKDGDKISLLKKKGRIEGLNKEEIPESSSIGIGHTRWATHGKPSDRNAHPFVDCSGNISIIHNGIIDNFVSIKEELQKKGHEFTSDTDSEVIAHLMEDYYDGDMVKAMQKTVEVLEGSFAIVAIHSEHDEIVAARDQSPLVVGVGDGENLLASDVPAILDHTQDVKYLRDGDIVRIKNDSVDIWDIDGNSVERETKTVDWSIEDAEKGGYEHYMMKEIHEQPKAIHDSILGRLKGFEGLDLKKYRIDSIRLIACGTSFHAALVGKYIIEEISGIPCMVEMASEYRYSSRLSVLFINPSSKANK